MALANVFKRTVTFAVISLHHSNHSHRWRHSNWKYSTFQPSFAPTIRSRTPNASYIQLSNRGCCKPCTTTGTNPIILQTFNVFAARNDSLNVMNENARV